MLFGRFDSRIFRPVHSRFARQLLCRRQCRKESIAPVVVLRSPVPLLRIGPVASVWPVRIPLPGKGQILNRPVGRRQDLPLENQGAPLRQSWSKVPNICSFGGRFRALSSGAAADSTANASNAPGIQLAGEFVPKTLRVRCGASLEKEWRRRNAAACVIDASPRAAISAEAR